MQINKCPQNSPGSKVSLQEAYFGSNGKGEGGAIDNKVMGLERHQEEQIL